VASGLSCPTRDGRISRTGCAFCDTRGSASFHSSPPASPSGSTNIREELLCQLPSIRARFGAGKFLAYFQSYTNTYGSAAALAVIYEQALSVPGISGLCIGTRPDCLNSEVLGVLRTFSERTYVSLELGIQSFDDSTLTWLKRGHDRATSLDALKRLALFAPSVHVCVHLIFGAPTDSATTARDTALLLNRFPLKGVKLHQLMILESTELGRRWKEAPFPTLSLQEYGEHVLEFIENLSPNVYLERLCASATQKQACLAPLWSCERWAPHNYLREFLVSRGCQQGSKIQPSDLTRIPFDENEKE